MDQDKVVIEMREDGAKLLEHLTGTGFDVTAAGWVQTYEDGQPYLYIASSAVDGRGVRDGYRVVQSTIRSLPPGWVTLSDVKLIGSKEPLAQGLLDVSRRNPGRMATWFNGTNLGGEGIDGPAYVYPPVSAPAPAGS